MGSSQLYYSIDPSVISRHSCNLANSNQDLFYDNQIFKKYEDKLPNLKTVIIGISYFTFEFQLSNTEEYWRQFFYERYLQMPSEDNNILNIKKYSLIALYGNQNSFDYLLKNFNVNLVENISSQGWFMAPINVSPFDHTLGQENAKRHTGYMKDDLTSKNIELLDKIIELAQSRKIKVVLVTTPTLESYYNSIDQHKYQKMQSNIISILNKYNIVYLNYFKDQRFNESDFTDYSDHLNQKSAERFSEILKKDLETVK